MQGEPIPGASVLPSPSQFLEDISSGLQSHPAQARGSLRSHAGLWAVLINHLEVLASSKQTIAHFQASASQKGHLQRCCLSARSSLKSRPPELSSWGTIPTKRLSSGWPWSPPRKAGHSQQGQPPVCGAGEQASLLGESFRNQQCHLFWKMAKKACRAPWRGFQKSRFDP